MKKIKLFFRDMTFTQILVVGYALVIVVGAVVLMLPISTSARTVTPLEDCLFTTTSAISGTGLILYDTYTHWSYFGQIVITIIMQIGGIGFMSMAIFALSFTSRKIGLKQRFTMRESISGISGSVVKTTRFILKGTIIIELLGTVGLMFFYAPRMGFLKGLYFSLFHSISAFCTAGFDLMGYYEPSSSLITANTDILLNVVLILLLNVGGIGFLTWDDIVRNKWHFKKYRVQSKIIIVVTVIFYVIGVAEMLLVERNNALAVTDNYNEKFLIASMLVTSGRDAGFSPIDISTLKPASILMMICFMFIGGAPGSTACGIKTTTFAVMVLTIVCVYRRKKHVECFGRRIESSAIRDASCVMTLYLIVVIVSTILICAIDDLELVPVLFEVVSAISSCGLSMGITTQLSDISCALITLIMFFGRIGGITFIVSLSSSSKQSKVVLPEEKIFIG